MDSAKLSKTFGMMTLKEVDYLKQVMGETDENPLVANVGTGAGTSLLAILEARPNAAVVTIDKLPTSVPGFLQEAGLAFANVTFITADSVEAAQQRMGGQFDVLVVDAGHLPEETTADLKAWVPLVKDNGIVLVHDYGVEYPMWEAVKTATDKYARYYGLQKIDSEGSLACFRKTRAKMKGRGDV